MKVIISSFENKGIFLNKVVKCQRKRGKIFANDVLESEKDEIRCQERYLW